MVEFSQHLKLPHLDLIGATVASGVKHLHCYLLTRFLQIGYIKIYIYCFTKHLLHIEGQYR